MNKRIKHAVAALRSKYGIDSLPVDLDELAHKAGIEIKYGHFDEETSGFALKKGASKYIGINEDEHETRQRFTIAHEFGHIFLHYEDKINYDEKVGLVYFRNPHSTLGTDNKEVEANAFAAELLMPEDAVREKIEAMGGLDLEDYDAVSELASIFSVSPAAITVRLTKLYSL